MAVSTAWAPEGSSQATGFQYQSFQLNLGSERALTQGDLTSPIGVEWISRSVKVRAVQSSDSTQHFLPTPTPTQRLCRA